MLTKDGEEIKKRVRDFFKKGFKSSNKLYDVALDGSVVLATLDAKKRKRWDDCGESAKHRLKGAKSYEELAQMLIKVSILTRAGNCGEMAALSAYYTVKTKFIKQSLVYVGELSDPGDHAFCLVAPVKLDDKFKKFSSVSDFTKERAAKSWLIIDPWLNVVCNANDYLTKGGQKLDKWATDGKRVAWHAGTQGPGWYVPNGEYKTEFGNAPVELMPF